MEALRFYFDPKTISASWLYPSDAVDGLVDVTDWPSNEIEALFY